MVNNTNVPESGQIQLANPRGASNMMDDLVCDICGDQGFKDDLAICNKCPNGAEHIYCMKEYMEKVPEGDWWMCGDCENSECQKSKSPVNLGSSISLKLKSSHARKRQTQGSNCFRHDAVQSCGQVYCGLQPNSHKAHKDVNCLNKGKKKESRQAAQPTEAATAMKLHESRTHLGSTDKKSPIEAATLSEKLSIPNLDYKWQGKFQIQRGDGIPSTCVGIQAHVSTCASEEVLAAMEKLTDVIVLDEVPRSKMWPSQFMESQATEENIILFFSPKYLYRGLMEYMSKNDLALKGNFDGVELLIFLSNVLPEKSQNWNKLLFLWGVFRENKIGDSANTPVSNSRKRKHGDIAGNHNNADNGKLPMDEKMNANKPESSPSLASPTSNEDNENQLYWGALETLSTFEWIRNYLKGL